MLRSILQISDWKFNLVFEPHDVQMYSAPSLFMFLFRLYINIYTPEYYVYAWKYPGLKKKRECIEKVGWNTRNTVSKNSRQNTCHWAGHSQSTVLGARLRCPSSCVCVKPSFLPVDIQHTQCPRSFFILERYQVLMQVMWSRKLRYRLVVHDDQKLKKIFLTALGG